MQGVQRLKQAIADIPELTILGKPVMNIVSYTAVEGGPDIYAIADFMENKGWMVDRQQFPNCIHLTVMTYNIPAIPEYLSDLREAIEYVKSHPKAADTGQAAMYGLMTRLPARGMVKKNVRNVILGIYDDSQDDYPASNGSAMNAPPRWMTILNRILRVFKK